MSNIDYIKHPCILNSTVLVDPRLEVLASLEDDLDITVHLLLPKKLLFKDLR